jgi:hypothetical protein
VVARLLALESMMRWSEVVEKSNICVRPSRQARIGWRALTVVTQHH